MRGKQPSQTNRARNLRRNATEAEIELWLLLRDRRLAGLKFVRQQPIGPYVVDFVCRARRVVVELDGGQHAGSVHDPRRDAWLRARDYKIIRIWNNDLLCNPNGVLEMLVAEVG